MMEPADDPTPPRSAPVPAYEVESEAALTSVLDSGMPLSRARLQGLDLRAHEDTLMNRRNLQGLIVLGGELSPRLEQHLRRHGAVIFPTDPSVPVRPYRGTLYTPEELYAGLNEGGYASTVDARAYVWSQDASIEHDAYVSMLRAIHDDAMSDALTAQLRGQDVVGVMGGHALHRGSAAFQQAAQLGHRLARAGVTVLTGGGPGAMEAANLGAWVGDEVDLDAALNALGAIPTFADGIAAWADLALRTRREVVATEVPSKHGDTPDSSRAAAERRRDLRSVGIPTWHFGHEPPNVFAQRIAKFFSNALREDLLLDSSNAGVVVLPGAAGTVQEVFAMVTKLYYESVDLPRPLILVGQRHWTRDVPVWPLLQSLGQGRAMADSLFLTDSTDEVLNVLGRG